MASLLQLGHAGATHFCRQIKLCAVALSNLLLTGASKRRIEKVKSTAFNPRTEWLVGSVLRINPAGRFGKKALQKLASPVRCSSSSFPSEATFAVRAIRSWRVKLAGIGRLRHAYLKLPTTLALKQKSAIHCNLWVAPSAPPSQLLNGGRGYAMQNARPIFLPHIFLPLSGLPTTSELQQFVGGTIRRTS
jgi:hypothetical protein